MITDEQKIKIKDLAATKPIEYIDGNIPTANEVRQDCLDYALSVFPEWNLFEINYFYEMVKSYLPKIYHADSEVPVQ